MKLYFKEDIFIIVYYYVGKLLKVKIGYDRVDVSKWFYKILS